MNANLHIYVHKYKTVLFLLSVAKMSSFVSILPMYYITHKALYADEIVFEV